VEHGGGFLEAGSARSEALAFAIPLLAVLAFHGNCPSALRHDPALHAGFRKNIQNVVNTQWTNVRKAVVDRAAWNG